MGCKALGEAKYRSNLMVVRILASRVTPQTAFYSLISIRFRRGCTYVRCPESGTSSSRPSAGHHPWRR